MKILLEILLDLKQLLSYLDASSFVSLSCVNQELNHQLRSHRQWTSRIHEHVKTRAHGVWEDMLLFMKRVPIRVYRGKAGLFNRDVKLYKNGPMWMKLQDKRQEEFKNIKNVQNVHALRQRVAELDATIANFDIGWTWFFVES